MYLNAGNVRWEMTQAREIVEGIPWNAIRYSHSRDIKLWIQLGNLREVMWHAIQGRSKSANAINLTSQPIVRINTSELHTKEVTAGLCSIIIFSLSLIFSRMNHGCFGRVRRQAALRESHIRITRLCIVCSGHTSLWKLKIKILSETFSS